MSAENVDLVRRWLGWSAPELDSIRAKVAECCLPDVVYHPARKFPDREPRHGAEELARWMVAFLESWVNLEFVVRDIIDIGDDRVLAWINMQGQGPGSGMDLEGDLYQCFWLRDDRFSRVEDHLTPRGALQALGLGGETLEAAGLRRPADLG